jgi:ABC-2 type transport system permease protein
MFVASINAMPAALFTLGVGVFVFGFWPRLTSMAMYAIVAWSFLMEMIGSAIQLNHYLLDTSLLHHVALAPAVDPNWHTAGILAGTGLLLTIIGALTFRVRDLATE